MYNLRMPNLSISPLEPIETRLRYLLPADLYAAAWVDTSTANLERVFEHLRALQHILHGYVCKHILDDPPQPGKTRYRKEKCKGALMFTDLSGFTRLMEANAAQGNAGATSLLQVLNAYFSTMIEIIHNSGGDLLEFTGDALLALFEEDKRHQDLDVERAVRAGLRMQRAMAQFAEIQTPQGTVQLGMRVGIHAGRFLMADIGTPRRMEHVLLGKAVHQAKLTEGAGRVGRVNLSPEAYRHVKDKFRFEDGEPGYKLTVDDLTDDELGEYEILPPRRQQPSMALTDRSQAGLLEQIARLLDHIEPLACFLPFPVLNLLVESASRRNISPDFPEPTIMFVNLIGLPELADLILPGQERQLFEVFSQAFALINAAVEARGGMLKKVTYHLSGSDIVVYFGVPTAHTNDPCRAADAALAIQKIVQGLKAPKVIGLDETLPVTCQIGICSGPAFVAEIGQRHGRREFNVLGDTVNTAARLMNRAGSNQIVISERVYNAVAAHFTCRSLGQVSLKGKSAPVAIYELLGSGHSS